MHSHSHRVAVLSVVFVVTTFNLAGTVSARPPALQSIGESNLVVEGRVSHVFQSTSSDRDFLVQILVQKSAAMRMDHLQRSTRYPAPGEYVYVHVDTPADSANRRSQPSSGLPGVGMDIRAVLQTGDHQNWVAGSQDWYQEISNGATSATTDNFAGLPGITTESVSLLSGRALKVTGVEPNSPAAKAGLEVGDVLVSANDVEMTRPEQLIEQIRSSGGVLNLVVRDVRTGRDVPVEVKWDAVMPQRGQGRNLGVTTEIAFFAGNAALKVVKVADGSPAQRAGIEPGLLLLSADNILLSGPESLARAERESNGTLVLRVVEPKTRVERNVRADLR